MTYSLMAVKRAETGKNVARRLRRLGQVPAVLYGHNEPTVPLTIEAKALERLLEEISVENTILDLRIDGEGTGAPLKVLVREVQQHPFLPEILHVDFFHVSMTEKLEVDVPVMLVGSPAGVRLQSGILEHVLRDVRVSCLPGNIPEKVEVDVTDLKIGDTVRVSDLQVANTELVTDPSRIVATVVPPTVIKEEVAAAPVAEEVEPELIGREKKEKEEEAEEAAPEGRGGTERGG